jgi:hypothetical protein
LRDDGQVGDEEGGAPHEDDMPACAVGVSGFVNAHVAAALERYQAQ